MPTPDENGGEMLEQNDVSYRLIIAVCVIKNERKVSLPLDHSAAS